MLVISRKHNESIVIGDRIVIEVLEIGPSKIRLGIAAPDNVRIVRGELQPKAPLAGHLDRVRQNRDAGLESIEIDLPVGAAEDNDAELVSSPPDGLVSGETIGPDGYRSGHTAGYTSSRPLHFGAARREGSDAASREGYGGSGRERAISCEAARQAWQASSRSSRPNPPRRDGRSTPPRGNTRGGSTRGDSTRGDSTRLGSTRVGSGERTPVGLAAGYQTSRGHQQPTWAEIAWSRLETMACENHDEVNEEGLAYQIVWRSWGSTAAPLGAWEHDTEVDPDSDNLIRAPWQAVVG